MNQTHPSYPKQLILFDIDGTLINTNGVGSRAMISALSAMFGESIERKGVTFAGSTDPAIVRDLLAENELFVEDLDQTLDALYKIFPDHLRQAASKDAPQLLPGVKNLLEAVFANPALGVGLVTGNNITGAKTKLEMVAVDFSRFAFGAFGNDALERNLLPPIALQRAEQVYKRTYPPRSALIIGDTPADIECAKVNGLPVLAVATGWHSYEELKSHSPEFLVENFSDLDHILGILEDSFRG